MAFIMKTTSFLISIFLFPLILSASNLKIVGIRESNLFELEDGTLVRLANVKVPSVKDDSTFTQLALFIKKYATDAYLNRVVAVEYSGKTDSSGHVLVHLFQHFPLQTLHINIIYLKKGFGWYSKNPPGPYQKELEEAALYARKKKRGVWDVHSFKSKGFSDYALSLFYGYAKPNDTSYNTSFSEMMLRLAPAKEMSGIEAKASVYIKRERGRICCECSGDEYIPPYRTETSYVFSLSGKFHKTFKWAAFSLGGTWLYLKDLYCSEAGPYFFIPTVTLKAGWMKKIFLSVSLWDFYRLSTYTLGVNYIFNNPFNRLWIGVGSSSEYKNRAFQLDYNFYKKYLLHVQGGCILKDKTEFYGRFGFGFILH